MKIIYLAKVKEPFLLEDHWTIPFMGGEFRPIMEEDKVTAFEITFFKQPLNLSPEFKKVEKGRLKGLITTRDSLLPAVRKILEKTLSYIQCYFDVEVNIEEIESFYYAEKKEEEGKVKISKWAESRAPIHLVLTYDYFTRAIMASEEGNAPTFESNLVKSARKSLKEGNFIDSFRYSFLLLESIYGEGNFKTKGLKDALFNSKELKGIIERVIKNYTFPKDGSNSKTDALLQGNPKVEDIINHLVDMRGFYFHGNIKRKDAWVPQDQKEAKSLAFLSKEIALGISHQAATNMFKESFNIQHYKDAKKVGAIMSLQVDFEYRKNYGEPDSKEKFIFNYPGTKITNRMAVEAVNNFVNFFRKTFPVGALKSATCKIKGEEQKVFDINFHV